jgi:soluble lytic murein transglycosylase
MKSMGSGWNFVAALATALSMVTVNAQSAEKTNPSATASRRSAATTKKKSALGHATDRKVHRVSDHTSTGRSGASSKSHARGIHPHTASSGVVLPVATVESRRLRSAFIASAQLRPMAQQLVIERNPTAYAGVIAYAGFGGFGGRARVYA